MTWEYISGYFDGEGTVYIAPPHGKSVNCQFVWHNNNLESLEEMYYFMRVGRIKGRKLRAGYTQQYILVVSKRSEMLKILPFLKANCIIKLPRLLEAEKVLATMRDQSKGWGNLAYAGEAEISRLYWDEKMNLKEIGDSLGVTWTAVRQYMRRHNISQRSRRSAMALAHWDSPGMKAGAEKKRASKIKQWQDPIYRERQLAAIKAARAAKVARMEE